MFLYFVCQRYSRLLVIFIISNECEKKMKKKPNPLQIKNINCETRVKSMKTMVYEVIS